MRGQAVGKGPSGMAWGMGPPAGRHGGAGVASRLARGQPVGVLLADHGCRGHTPPRQPPFLDTDQ